MLLVDTAHQRGGRRQHFINKDKDGFLGAELDAFADHVDELSDGQVCRYQVLLLVDGGNVGLFDFFTDDLSNGRRC